MVVLRGGGREVPPHHPAQGEGCLEAGFASLTPIRYSVM